MSTLETSFKLVMLIGEVVLMTIVVGRRVACLLVEVEAIAFGVDFLLAHDCDNRRIEYDEKNEARLCPSKDSKSAGWVRPCLFICSKVRRSSP